MFDAAALKGAAEFFGFFNTDRTNQNRLPLFVAGFDLLNNGLEFGFFCFIEHIGIVDADHGFVGGYLHAVQVINLLKFFAFGHGGTGHAGQFVIQTEIVLEGNGRQCAAFMADIHIFFRFDRLMQAVGIASAQHDASGELINDQNFAVLHHIINIALHNAVGFQCLIQVML